MGKFKKTRDDSECPVTVEADGTIKLYDADKPVKKQQKDEVKELLKRAKKGDGEAQLRLSKYYYYGMCGLKKDSKKAIEWFEKYAVRADKIKQWQLAVAYRTGKEIQQNYKKAIYWYTKSAEQGYTASQYELACFYYDGKIVGKDYKKAVYWFEKAAEQKHVKSLEKLAYCFKHGLGVEKSITKADYYEGLIYEYTGRKPMPKQVKKQILPEKELTAEKKKHEYKLNPDIYLSEFEKIKQKAEAGDADAQVIVGYYYFDGSPEVKQDYSMAAYWFSKAVEQGNTGAQFLLGCCCYREGGQANYTVAVRWFSELANLGMPEAQHNLAICYYYGHGVEQSYERARQLFEQAAARGYQPSINALIDY